jgi:hypothetical protein
MAEPVNVTQALERIQTEHQGLLRPVDVVAEAVSPASPLHPYFEWDDTLAGHQYRLAQARHLIRVMVQYEPYAEPQHEVRVYVSLSPDRQYPHGGYRVMVDVLSDASYRAQLLTDALEELNRLRIKYHMLTELAGVFASAARAQASYGGSAPPPPPPSSPGGGGTNATT